MTRRHHNVSQLMRLTDPPPGRRSPLFAWYLREWDVLSGAPINWGWLMGEIAKRGLVDRKGNPPKLETAKQTWHRCKVMMGKREVAKALPTSQRRPSPEPARPMPISQRQFCPAKIKE